MLFDVSKMNIVVCEGNVSMKSGNACGLKKASLEDKEKNPSGYHRCWANLNSPEDELWKITKELFESDTVIFLGSNRWGQPNSIYQKLIERLNWIENRYTTLGEDNIVADVESGMIWLGHNWNMESTLELQKEVHEFYGFSINDKLYWGWQYTQDSNDESKEGYKQDFPEFKDKYLQKYMDARKKAGLDETIRDTQDNFMKFMIQDAKIPTIDTDEILPKIE